jgi:hypothetical protein
MNYINSVVTDYADPPNPIWTRIGRLIRRQIAQIKWDLKQRGWPVRFSYKDAQADARYKPIENGWEWKTEEPPTSDMIREIIEEEMIPWLDEAILRSPVPLGIDGQGILIKVFLNEEQVAEHGRSVDKYGWRKSGKKETATWLSETFTSLNTKQAKVFVCVVSMGKLIVDYDLAKPYISA